MICKSNTCNVIVHEFTLRSNIPLDFTFKFSLYKHWLATCSLKSNYFYSFFCRWSMCELSEFGRKSIWNIVIVHIKCNILYICMQKELQITRWLTLGHLLYPLRWSVNFNHVYHDKINQYKIMITNSAKELVSFTFWKSNNMRLKRIYTLILFSKNVVVWEYLKLIPRFISCKYKCIVLCTLRGKSNNKQNTYYKYIVNGWLCVSNDTGKPSIQLFNDRYFMSGIFVRFYVLLYIDL